jgi:hypothetical protein
MVGRLLFKVTWEIDMYPLGKFITVDHCRSITTQTESSMQRTVMSHFGNIKTNDAMPNPAIKNLRLDL